LRSAKEPDYRIIASANPALTYLPLLELNGNQILLNHLNKERPAGSEIQQVYLILSVF